MGNNNFFVVRQYDYYDNQWIDVTGPLSEEEANSYWNLKTGCGTRNSEYEHKLYYKIFPADTKMLYSDGFGEI